MMRHVWILMVILAAATPVFAQDAGWIGVRVEDQKDRGVLIREVTPNSPAAKAGLKDGDVLIEFNKQDVAGVLQLTRLVRETPVGRTVEVKVRRDNRDQTFQVTTDRAPAAIFVGRIDADLSGLSDRIRRQFPDLQRKSAVQFGLQVESLTPQLREFFGVAADEGVLVASVDANSAASKAGLKAGDVITSVDGKRVSSAQEFTRQVRSAGAMITLKVMRDKKEREVMLEGTAARRSLQRGNRLGASKPNAV